MTTEVLAGFQERLIAMIVDDITFGAPVAADTDLLLTGLVDSLGVIRIVAWIEAELGIDIDPGDVVLEHFQTVDQMIAYLDAR